MHHAHRFKEAISRLNRAFACHAARSDVNVDGSVLRNHAAVKRANVLSRRSRVWGFGSAAGKMHLRLDLIAGFDASLQ